MADSTSTTTRATHASVRRERPLRSARDQGVRAVGRHLGAGSSVVVVGVPGAGRSYVAARVVDMLPGAHVVAVRSATASPGLIVTTVQAPAAPSSIGAVSHLVSSTAVAALAPDDRERAGARTVVLADDAHLLAPDHLRTLCDLAVDSRITLLATTETSETVDGSHREAVSLLTSLWRDGDAERIDLSALTSEEAHDLVRAVAGARPVDLATRHAIVVAGDGSPATIKELTQSVLRSSVPDGLSSLRVPSVVSPSPRAVERARRRLANLSEYEHDALLALARLGSFDAERGGRYVGEGTLRRLVQHGCVSAAGSSPGVLRAARVDADVVRSARPTGGRDQTLERALQSMVELDAAGLCLEPFECLALSDSWAQATGGPQSVTPGVGPDQVSRISTVAARKAMAMRLPYRALSHAVQALDAQPTVAGAVEASRALAALQNRRAARTVLGRAPADAPDHDLELLHLWRAELDDWDVGTSAGGSIDRLDGSGQEPASIRDLRAAVLAMRRLRWAEALATACTVVEDGDAGLVVRLRACSAASRSAAFLAQGAELERLDQLGRRLHAELVQQCGSATAQEAVDEEARLLAGAVAARVVCGLGWAEIPVELDAMMRRAVAAGDLAHTVEPSALLGCHALVTGDIDLADTETAVALERVGEPSDHDLHAWILAARASTLARTGRAEEAGELCAALDPAGEEITPWAQVLLAAVRRQWTGPDCGTSRPLAVSEITRITDVAELVTHQPTIALVQAAEVAVRSHGHSLPRDLVDVASAVRHLTDVAPLRAVADYVVASSQSDAPALAVLGSTFDALGMPQLAAACEGQRLGHPVRDEPDGPPGRRPLETGASDSTAPEALTVREAEVAALAGRGLTNKQIAQRLFLSVRTVESHVYLARRKLGASRRELADRLADEGLL